MGLMKPQGKVFHEMRVVPGGSTRREMGRCVTVAGVPPENGRWKYSRRKQRQVVPGR